MGDAVKIKCDFCEQKFTRNSDKKRHIQDFHSIQRTFKCPHCTSKFLSFVQLKDHLKEHLYTPQLFFIHKKAFNNITVIYRHISEKISLESAFNENIRSELQTIIESETIKRQRLILKLACYVVFVTLNIEGGVDKQIESCFQSRKQQISVSGLSSSNFILRQCIQDLSRRIENFEDLGSGWSVERITKIDINFSSLL